MQFLTLLHRLSSIIHAVESGQPFSNRGSVRVGHQTLNFDFQVTIPPEDEWSKTPITHDWPGKFAFGLSLLEFAAEVELMHEGTKSWTFSIRGVPVKVDLVLNVI